MADKDAKEKGEGDPVLTACYLRRGRRSALTKHSLAIRKAIVDEDVKELETRLKSIKSMYIKFEQAHEAYHAFLVDAAELDASDEVFFNVTKDYIECVKQGKDFLKPKTEDKDPKADPKADTSKISDIAGAMTLPKLELPIFNGDIKSYPRFITLFKDMVESRTSDDRVRLSHLLYHTSGPARASIEDCGMSTSGDGYNEAMSILKERFGNKFSITRAIISNLKSTKSCHKPVELRQLADELRSAYRILVEYDALKQVDSLDTIMQISERCHPQIRSRWSSRAYDYRETHDDYPDFKFFLEFLEGQAKRVNDPALGVKTADKTGKAAYANAACSSPADSHPVKVTTQQKPLISESCMLCPQNHTLFNCQVFRSMKPYDRVKFAREKHLCFICLVPGHMAKSCRRTPTCNEPGCTFKHTKFLHVPKARDATDVQSTASCNTYKSASDVYLPMVPVIINGSEKVYALLDNGSSDTLITGALAKRLGIVGKRTKCIMSTVSGHKQIQSSYVSFHLNDVNSTYKTQISQALIVPEIPARYPVDRGSLEQSEHLANVPLPIIPPGSAADVLIGVNHSELLAPLAVKSDPKNSKLYAIQCVLGWYVQGHGNSSTVNANVTVNHVAVGNLESDLSNLWSVEQSDDTLQGWSSDDRQVHELWQSKISIKDGHYVLPIPWKQNPPMLPNNKFLAKKRLDSTIRKLERTNNFTKYDENMSKMLEDGYSEIVPPQDLLRNDGKVWYLPHHAVTSEAKPGKVRIVYDCAAVYQGVSLNDSCYQGPDLNNKLHHVLLRFRQHPVAIMAYIEAMYHQVKIPIDDRDCLRFLWYRQGQVEEFRMTSHLFGGVWCASSSTFALRQCVKDFPCSSEVVKAVNRGFYVDDLLYSFPDVQTAKEVMFGTRDVLRHGGFNLVKFVANCPDLLVQIPKIDQAVEVQDITKDPMCKALGVRWDVNRDSFYYVAKVLQTDSDLLSRRVILRQVASMYDPLGLLCPVVILGRLLFQQATKLELLWDVKVPDTILLPWSQWIASLQDLDRLVFPRCLIPLEFVNSACELHVFCDGSLKAYGACAYLRAINEHGHIHVRLVAAKGRIAPIKQTTVPRLELCAAVTAAKLGHIVRRELDIDMLPTRFWSDSTIVLAYIKSESHRFKTFVANRVSVIHDLCVREAWGFIPTDENPADVLTRGSLPSDLPDSWFVGPEFLHKHKSDWISYSCAFPIPHQDNEVRVNQVYKFESPVSSPIQKLIDHYSDLYRLKKAIVWLVRFLKRLKSGESKTSHITVSELVNAERLLVQFVQRKHYSEVIHALTEGLPVPKSSPILRCSPVLVNDFLVVGGRIKHSTASKSVLHPYIMPSHDKLSLLILRYYHNAAHLGTEWVLSQVREKFWIVRARPLLKQVRRNCFVCKRLYNKPLEQKMADLPKERCSQTKSAFTHVGVDIFGPFLVTVGRAQAKRYGCVYSCMTTRAIHLEVLNSLTTDSFINGFVRFCARRGYPETVRSDNGTNLVGANKELRSHLKQVDRNAIIASARRQEVEWSFNTPYASHHGGVWERMIRTIRRILMALFHDVHGVNDEVITTVFCEVEGLINSRPLTKLSDDPTDLEPLTPNHLLLLKGNFSLPWGTCSASEALRKRWSRVQQIVNKFWKRWLRDYLPLLQLRSKWHHAFDNVRKGDLVLLQDDSVPRGSWPLGLVEDVFLSQDGLVRSLKVRTNTSSYVRPITKVVMLEESRH